MMDFLADRFAPGPLFGWLCVLFALAVPLIWVFANPVRRRPAVRFSFVSPFSAVRRSWATRARWILPLLRTLAVAALIVAMARPQAGGEYRDVREGIAIQMVLDVSGSMAEQDFVIDGRPARRLDAVKKVFKDFVLGTGTLGGRGNDLLGMTTFAMYADTVCPLTLDHGSLIDLLEETEIPGWLDGRQVREDLEAGHTALGEAIALATDDLRRAGEKAAAGVPGAEAAKSKVMILLTDGRDNPAPHPEIEPPDPVKAAEVAATLGIKIYTIGAVGDQPSGRGFMSLFDPRAGVDEQTLKEIARVTDGKYFRATNTDALKTVYEEIDQLERRRTGERTFHDDIRAAHLAMWAAMAFLFLELLLVNTRFRQVP